MDADTGFDSTEFMKRSVQKWRILVTQAAGEAHTSNAVVERRHQVLRKALEIYVRRACCMRDHTGVDRALLIERLIQFPQSPVAQTLRALDGTCSCSALALLEGGWHWKTPWKIVVLKEPNSDGKTSARGLVHGTSQVRCSPVHVRPDLADVGHARTDNLELARTQ